MARTWFADYAVDRQEADPDPALDALPEWGEPVLTSGSGAAVTTWFRSRQEPAYYALVGVSGH